MSKKDPPITFGHFLATPPPLLYCADRFFSTVVDHFWSLLGLAPSPKSAVIYGQPLTARLTMLSYSPYCLTHPISPIVKATPS